MREAHINVRVRLRGDKVPESILWSATDSPFPGEKECDAAILSIWDPEEANTLSLELWTDRLTTRQMNVFALQVVLKLAETVRRATADSEFPSLLEECAESFARRLEKSGDGSAQR